MHSKLLPHLRPDRDDCPEGLLADDVVFHSPVRDYTGRADVAHILMTLAAVLDEIEPQGQLVAGHQIVTIITTSHHGHRMTGVLNETHDSFGRVEQATLLLRPLSALLDAIAAMRAALERSPLPSTLPA